jgi:hypothetical protein
MATREDTHLAVGSRSSSPRVTSYRSSLSDSTFTRQLFVSQYGVEVEHETVSTSLIELRGVRPNEPLRARRD